MRNIALLVLAAVIAFTVPASAGPPTYYGFFESPGGGSVDGNAIPNSGFAFGKLTQGLITQSLATDCQGVESNGIRIEVGPSLVPAFVSKADGTEQAACGSFFANGAIVGGSFTLTDGWSWQGNTGDSCAGVTDTNGYTFSSLVPAISQTVDATGNLGLCHGLGVTGNYTTTNGNLTTTNGNIVSTNGDLIASNGFLFWGGGYGIGANSDTCAGVTASAFTIENVSASVVLTGDTSHNIGGCGNITAVGTIGGGGNSGFTFTNSGGTAVASGPIYATVASTAGPTPPCFTIAGGACPDPANEHIVHGTLTTTTSGSCTAGNACALASSGAVTFSGSAAYTSGTTFACYGNDVDNNAVAQIVPASSSGFLTEIVNSTGGTISGGTAVAIQFSCEGH